jgi:hypothetical protein
MGKRSAVCLKGPSLIEIENLLPPSIRRKMSTPFDTAALTLLSLKQEQTSPGSAESSVTGLGSTGSSHRKSIMSSESRSRSPSMCSSVTDDERSVLKDELSESFIKFPQSGHSLVRMALVCPKLHADSSKKKICPKTPVSFPNWITPAKGRPLPAPPRLPRGIVSAAELRVKGISRD